jgi:hypothetical protein
MAISGDFCDVFAPIRLMGLKIRTANVVRKRMRATIGLILMCIVLCSTGCSRFHMPQMHWPKFGKQQEPTAHSVTPTPPPAPAQIQAPEPPPPAPVVQHAATTAPAKPLIPAPVLPSPPEVSSKYAQDIALLKRFGGGLTITEPDPASKQSRIDLVWFNPLEHKLSDEDLIDLSPALHRMNPLRLDLKGQPISDKSIDILNRLESLRVLDVSKTDVTFEGLKQLHLKQLQQVSVTRSLLTSEQYEELKKTLGSVTVMRL